MLKKVEFHNELATVPKAATTKVFYGVNNDIPKAEGYTGIINPETGHLFSIVSPKYRIVQHTEILEKIEETIAAHIEYGSFQRKILTFDNGAKLQAKYTFPDVSVSIDNSSDLIHPSIEVRNGYDGIWNFGVLFGAFRLVCSNGLVIGQKVLNFHKKHFNPAQFFLKQDMLSDSMEQFSEQANIWKTWSNKVMEQAQIEHELEAMELREKEIEGIKTLVETSTGISLIAQQAITQWIFYNILTQYITHNVTSINRQIELEAKMRKMF